MQTLPQMLLFRPSLLLKIALHLNEVCLPLVSPFSAMDGIPALVTGHMILQKNPVIRFRVNWLTKHKIVHTKNLWIQFENSFFVCRYQFS